MLGPVYSRSHCSSSKVRAGRDRNRRGLLAGKGRYEKKKIPSRHRWLPAFLSPHTTRGKVSLRSLARSLSRSLWLLSAPSPTLSFPPLRLLAWRNHSLNESLGLPQWPTGLSSLPLHFHPLARSHVSVSVARPTALRNTDMEVFWARSGKRHRDGFIYLFILRGGGGVGSVNMRSIW